LLCSSSSPRKTFLSSPNHHNLRISLPVTFGCSLLWKWASTGHVSQLWRPNSGRFQNKLSRIDGASVCAQGPYFEDDQVRVAVCPIITVQCCHSRNFLTAYRIKNTFLA
jgi:hypothetical protein